jgi:hypothetical protein
LLRCCRAVWVNPLVNVLIFALQQGNEGIELLQSLQDASYRLLNYIDSQEMLIEPALKNLSSQLKFKKKTRVGKKITPPPSRLPIDKKTLIIKSSIN